METTNYLLGHPELKIVQNTDMFHFSLDSILLPNFVTINQKISKILDIGCGNAPVPLILSKRTSAAIIGVEIQEQVFKLAKKTININGLQNQIKILLGDINDFYEQWETDIYDVITANPPFFPCNSTSNINKSEHQKLARHELTLNLETILKISRKLLKNNGVLAMVYRPERLVDIVTQMRNYNIEPKRICFVYPKKGKPANILLIEGCKNGKPGLKLEPILIAHHSDGNYTEDLLNFVSRGEHYESKEL